MQFDPKEGEIKALKARIIELEQENERLQEERDLSKGITLHDIEQKILLCLHSSQHPMQSTAIKSEIHADTTKADYYVERLLKDKYICDQIAIGSPRTYKLDQRGREYLIVNSLI